MFFEEDNIYKKHWSQRDYYFIVHTVVYGWEIFWKGKYEKKQIIFGMTKKIIPLVL